MSRAWIALLVVTVTVLTALTAFASPPKVGEAARSVEVFEAVIVSVDNSTVVVDRDGERLTLLADGSWIALTNESVSKGSWDEVSSDVRAGEALVVAALVGREGADGVLAGLKQEGITLIRLALIKHCAKRHFHTRAYMGVRGVIAGKGSNYLLIERGGVRAIALVNGEWVKAGYGKVTWDEVSDEFEVGDIVRIFCHNILIMNDEFAKVFGVRAFIWGYSGAIVDLTSGVTLSRA